MSRLLVDVGILGGHAPGRFLRIAWRSQHAHGQQATNGQAKFEEDIVHVFFLCDF